MTYPPKVENPRADHAEPPIIGDRSAGSKFPKCLTINGETAAQFQQPRVSRRVAESTAAQHGHQAAVMPSRCDAKPL